MNTQIAKKDRPGAIGKPATGLAALDELAADAKEINHALVTVWKARYCEPSDDEWEPALVLLTHDWPTLSRNIKRSQAAISEGLDEATRAEISKHIAATLGAFPMSNAPDPAMYTQMLVEEISAKRPARIVIDSACRHIRRTSRWPPTIAEVLTAVDDADHDWRRCLQSADELMANRDGYLERMRQNRASAIASEERDLERNQAELARARDFEKMDSRHKEYLIENIEGLIELSERRLARLRKIAV